MFDSVDGLAVDPHPATAFVWSRHLLRIRVGRYRVIYAVDEDARRIEIIHLGRSVS